jgi:hypothetical protein
VASARAAAVISESIAVSASACGIPPHLSLPSFDLQR